MAAEKESLAQYVHDMGTSMSYPRNSEIFGENEPASYLYELVNGPVRTYKVLNDGRRQIGGFYLPATCSALKSQTSIRFRRR